MNMYIMKNRVSYYVWIPQMAHNRDEAIIKNDDYIEHGIDSDELEPDDWDDVKVEFADEMREVSP